MVAHSPYTLCLVTDRGYLGQRTLVDVVEAAVRGGVTMVQLREKTGTTRAFLDDAFAMKELLTPRNIPLIINDRVDVALAVDADGVHVGQTDMPVEMVRDLMGPDKLIGLSITNRAQIDAPDAQLVDYLGIGPLYAQSTKPDASTPLGVAGFAALRSRTQKPVLAIGGLTVANAPRVIAAGATGLAVVSALMAAKDVEAAAQAFRAL